MITSARFAFALVSSLALPCAAVAEEVKGPVHLEGHGYLSDREEALDDAREDVSDAKQDIAEARDSLSGARRDLERAEAGDFSRIVTIVDDEPIKCGDPARYPGCVPYTAEEKARMVEEMRADLAEAERDLKGAERDLAEAERQLAQLAP